MVTANYYAYARAFLDHLERRNMPVADVAKVQVEKCLHDAVGLFRKRHGTSSGPYWRSIPRADIHALRAAGDHRQNHRIDEGRQCREVETYPGTHHGFAFPKRPVYNRDLAERHWERLPAPYYRNLSK